MIGKGLSVQTGMDWTMNYTPVFTMLIKTGIIIISCFCLEMEKRKHENAFTAIGYSYNTAQTSSHKPQNHNLKVPFDGAPFYMTLRHVEHPSTATVDCGSEKDKFVPCGGLVLPSGMQLVSVVYGRLTGLIICRGGC